MLAEEHPDLFAEAVCYEQSHKDCRQYTWTQGESLLDLLARKAQIIAEYEKAMVREKQCAKKQPLAEVLAAVLDDEDDVLPCLVCNL